MSGTCTPLVHAHAGSVHLTVQVTAKADPLLQAVLKLKILLLFEISVSHGYP